MCCQTDELGRAIIARGANTTLYESTLSDGSKVYTLRVYGNYKTDPCTELECVDQEKALNIMNAIKVGVA